MERLDKIIASQGKYSRSEVKKLVKAGLVTVNGSVVKSSDIKCDVNTICVGMAASMGAFLLSAGAKGKRMALPNSEIMIHQPSAGTQGQITDMAIHMQRLQTIKERMNRILAENTGKSIEEVTSACERDHFLTAEEALAFGLIDEIVQRH